MAASHQRARKRGRRRRGRFRRRRQCMFDLNDPKKNIFSFLFSHPGELKYHISLPYQKNVPLTSLNPPPSYSSQDPNQTISLPPLRILLLVPKTQDQGLNNLNTQTRAMHPQAQNKIFAPETRWMKEHETHPLPTPSPQGFDWQTQKPREKTMNQSTRDSYAFHIQPPPFFLPTPQPFDQSLTSNSQIFPHHQSFRLLSQQPPRGDTKRGCQPHMEKGSMITVL